MNDEETFLNLCKTEIHRDGIQELTDWLKKSDFFTAPASTKFHGNFEGGLCKHSLNVAQMLSDLCTLQNLSFNRESVFIVSLFHDLCKVNFYKKGFRIIKDENGCWITKEFWEIDEKFPCGDHADKSIILLQQYMKLSLNIHEKLLKIADMSGVLRKNKSGFNYKYTTEDEIQAKITAGMQKYGVMLYPSLVPGSLSIIPYHYDKPKTPRSLFWLCL